MKKINLLIAVLCFCLSSLQAQTAIDNTYTNPVGDNIRMGDPFVLLYNKTYYLYGTNAGDGYKCWSSTNLRDWKSEGYAYRIKDTTSYGSGNFWAPEVVYYKGMFYIVYSCNPRKDKKRMLICLAESKSPTGPFIDKYTPLFDKGFSCIDGDILIDKDRLVLYFDRVGYEGQWPNGYMYGIIYAMELDPSTLLPKGDTVRCSEASKAWENPLSNFSRCNEGAFVFKHDNLYYLTYSANHYADPNYGIGYATAKSPFGPWIKANENPIVRKDTVLGLYGPGHNSITTSPDGKEMFIVYHAHVSEKDKSRTLNIDRITSDKEGMLKVVGPTRTPQILPSGAGRK
jgi:GH43 family beta-xylosidase